MLFLLMIFFHFCWMFPISNKSDVYSTFVKFKLLVEKQFQFTIRQFQSDNGGEYCSTIFKQFLRDNGIFHRLLCPHISQQNGLAKRKYRHVMDMELTLLAQSGLSKKFWVDAFLTAIFIINRLPTKILDYVSPYERLFHLPPNFTYFRAFGCQCFPCLRPYTNDKLSYRRIPCIFIGYISNHKGFRCLDPSSRCVYISRIVIFDEEQFPAHSIITGPVSCVSSSGKSPGLFFTPPSYIFSSPATSSPTQALADLTLHDIHTALVVNSNEYHLHSSLPSLYSGQPESSKSVPIPSAPTLSPSSDHHHNAILNL